MNDVCFKLLRSGLYGTELDPVDLPSDIDWGEVVAFAHNNTVEGLIADAVIRLTSQRDVPVTVRTYFMTSAAKICNAHTLLNGKLSELVEFYSSNGFNPVLLKGQGLALCYRNPLLRSCGDIDLYIGERDYVRACALAKERFAIDGPENPEVLQHFDFHWGKVVVELHRIAALPTPVHGQAILRWFESELEKRESYRHMEVNGLCICLPSPLFDAFFIFHHAWRHMLEGGVGLRQVCDWTMVLDKYCGQIDTYELERVLRKFSLMRPWQLFGNIAVDYLGLDKEKMPCYNPELKGRSKKLLDVVLECGNFGHYTQVYSHEKLHGPWMNRVGQILSKRLSWCVRLYPVVPKDATLKFVTDFIKTCGEALERRLSSKKF